MMPRVVMLLLPLAGIALFLTLPVQGADQRIVCYYTNWSQYRPSVGKYAPENVDPNLCTHYIYAFAVLNGNKVKAYEWNDLSTAWSKGMMERFMDLKRYNPKAKTLLAVGGWNFGSGPFHKMVITQSGRTEFANSVVKFLRDNKFEGVDIDWEYPANRGSPPEDKNHFTELLRVVRDAFEAEAQKTGNPRLMISAAVAAGKSNIDTAYDIPAISKILDFISVMTYDLHGSWEDHTGHNSPLFARASETGDDKYLNLAWAAEYWAQLGAPKDMLNIGVALYGRTFTLSTSDTRLGAPASGPGKAGPYTREAGFLSYQEICEMKRNGGTVVDIPEQRVRYMYKDNQWVGYDDKESLQEKVCYIKSHGFGGVLVWAPDLDDFSGTDCYEGHYPLLHAVVNELESPDTTHCDGSGQVSTIHTTQPTTPQPTPQPTPQTTPQTRTQTTAQTTAQTTTQTATQTTTHTPTQTPTQTTTQTPTQTTTQTPTQTTTQTTKQPYVYTTKPHTTTGSKHFSCYGRESVFFASPFSCNEYFICANGMAFRVNCALGLRFNPHTQYCDRKTNVPCILGSFPNGIMNVTMKGPTTEPATQTTRKITANDYCRGKANGLYPDSHDCSRYYQCYMQLGFERSCNKNLAFNSKIQGCDFPYRVPGC